MRRGGVGPAALALAALIATGCGSTASTGADADRGAPTGDGSAGVTEASTGDAPTTTAAEPGAAADGVVHLTRTYERVSGEGERRVLPTEIWLPAEGEAAPVVAFAHGLDGHPSKFTELFAAWAAAGYAVVAPEFPHSSSESTDEQSDQIADAPQQPLDLSAALAGALADTADAADSLGGRLDADRVLVAGLSMGGGTALALAYGDCCPDLEPLAVVALSPLRFPPAAPDGTPPLFLFHGTADPTLPHSGSLELFNGATGTRSFVSLVGGSHAEPYEDSPSPFDDLVAPLTLAAFDIATGRTGPEALAAVVDSAPDLLSIFSAI